MIEATKLTKEEFSNLKPLNNNVIIECVIPKEEIRPSGLIIPKDIDYFIAHDIDGVNKTDTSAHLDRYGVVTKVPDKLSYNGDGKLQNDWMMPWETEMELQVGDMVWFDFYRGKHSPFLEVEDKTYRVVNYRFLIVAKRQCFGCISEDNNGVSLVYLTDGINKYEKLEGHELTSEQLKKVILLNGYCLFEQVFETPDSKLIIEKQLNKSQGIVKYIGNRNKSYKNIKKFDDIDIQIGDKVLFRNETECLLENENHYKFDTVPLRYNQRADVLGLIN
jgi:co-chaperonin GroES (HSP10)